MKKFALIMLVVFSIVFCAGHAETLFSSDPDAIEEAAKSVLMLEIFDSDNELIGTGSGFVAFDNRTIVTNYHVIDGADWIRANSDTGYQYMVTNVLIADENKDIAICSFMSPTDLIPLEFNAERELKRAEGIVAIGSPRGITNTVSLGNISALYEDNSVSWIQFTAPISSGSSGGALFDNDGKVIGVTSATLTDAQNINFAVHISEVEQLFRSWDGKELPFDEYLVALNPTPTPTPVPTVSPAPNQYRRPKVYSTPVPVPSKKDYDPLWFGDHGNNVKKLQQALIDYGYLEGSADGIFGNMTEKAVQVFNEVHGLIPVGFPVGPETQQLLFDGHPYKYSDSWMAICIGEDTFAKWEELDNDNLRIRIPVRSRANKKKIASFELYVYATDSSGKKIYGDTYYYETTEKTIYPGEIVYSEIILPEYSQIQYIWCGIHKVSYHDGTFFFVPNYWDYRIEYRFDEEIGSGEMKPWT